MVVACVDFVGICVDIVAAAESAAAEPAVAASLAGQISSPCVWLMEAQAIGFRTSRRLNQLSTTMARLDYHLTAIEKALTGVENLMNNPDVLAVVGDQDAIAPTAVAEPPDAAVASTRGNPPHDLVAAPAAATATASRADLSSADLLKYDRNPRGRRGLNKVVGQAPQQATTSAGLYVVTTLAPRMPPTTPVVCSCDDLEAMTPRQEFGGKKACTIQRE